MDVLENGARRFSGTLHCLQHIHSQEGIGGLYRGFNASLQFVAVSRAVFFGLFDTLRSKLGTERGEDLSFLGRQLHNNSALCFTKMDFFSSLVLGTSLDHHLLRHLLPSGHGSSTTDDAIR